MALWSKFAAETGALLERFNALEQEIFDVDQMQDVREQGIFDLEQIQNMREQRKANTVLGFYH